MYTLKLSRDDVDGDGVVYFASLVDCCEGILSSVINRRLHHLYDHQSVHLTHRNTTAVGFDRLAVLAHCHFRLRGTCIQQYLYHSQYTVVRAIPPVNGRWRFSATWGSETPEPIELKFGMIQYVIKLQFFYS